LAKVSQKFIKKCNKIPFRSGCDSVNAFPGQRKIKRFTGTGQNDVTTFRSIGIE